MEIKPIRTEADYDAALRHIETLWGAAQGTPEGDELEVLATLVESYENEHYPVDLPDPIEAIEFRARAARQRLPRIGRSNWPAHPRI